MTNTFIEISKLIMVSGWLLFMAIMDIQGSRIPNKYMKWFLIMSTGFIVINYIKDPIPVISSFVITSAVALGIYHFKGMGGADVKIMVILSLLYPIPINLFPFAILVFGVAGIAVGIYGFFIASENNQTIDDIKNKRIPFVPFMLAGYLVILMAVF